jgi:hypothetical protein
MRELGLRGAQWAKCAHGERAKLAARSIWIELSTSPLNGRGMLRAKMTHKALCTVCKTDCQSPRCGWRKRRSVGYQRLSGRD